MQALASLGAVRAGPEGLPACVGTGGAVHLGEGRWLTVAHLVDGSSQAARGCPASPLPIRVTPGGPARLLRAGPYRTDPGAGQRYLGAEDLALLAAPAAAAMATPCADPPRPGQPALLAMPGRQIMTRIDRLAGEQDPRFGTYVEVPLALQPGDSGGALFDAATGCLAGLVSHREEDGGPPRARLVPAAVIRRFVTGPGG
jgi:hypothetical protein